MVRVFPKSANQPNEITLTICTSISRNCFRLMRDWKLESLANGREISAVPFRTEKEEYLWRYSTISERNSGKLPYHLTSNRNFRIFSPNGKHPWFPRIFAQFASKIFAQSLESVSPQYRCFLKFLRKSFLMFCVTEKPVILVELLLRLRIVVIEDSEFNGERFVCKKKIALGNIDWLQNVHRVYTGDTGDW